MNNKEEFLEIYSKITRNGSKELLEWLENETDFFTAPASSKFHGAYEGGLVEHSVDVFNELQRLLKVYPEIKCSDETAAIVSLLHDLCKVNYYKIDYKNAKNAFGQWEKVPYFAVDEQFHFGGHGDKSVFLVMKHMMLTDEEAVAIKNHMGNDDGKYTCGPAFEAYPLAWILHVADEASTYLLNRKA